MRPRAAALATCFCFTIGAGSAWGRGGGRPQPPTHLAIDGEPFMYNATSAGFRAYLETIKADNPTLYAQLVPDLAHLERRESISDTIEAVSIGIGFAALLGALAVAVLTDCRWPPASDPNHAADVAAAGACDRRSTVKVFAVAGVGLGMSIGAVAAGSALGPEGHELADLIAKHNRLNTRQMRIHVGGSANVASASAGLTFTF